MILEGIITTLNADGSVHVAPMGPQVDNDFRRFELRPFQSSHTFGNLQTTRQGVLNVTDDVELLAQAAIGRVAPRPKVTPAPEIDGCYLSDTCRWYAFRVRSIDASQPRARCICDVVAHGRLRDFFGWNRAKHGILELAILATRVAWIPHPVIRQELERTAVMVAKTGGDAERRALECLRLFLSEHLARGTE